MQPETVSLVATAATDGEKARDFLLREHYSLRQEILHRLGSSQDTEKTALLSTSAIYAYLISFDNSSAFPFITLLLWWAPFFAMLFAWTKLRHNEKRLRQISNYLSRIELYFYGQNGYHSQGYTTKGWERELRAPENEQDFIMGAVEAVFWRLMILISFVVATILTSKTLGLIEIHADWMRNTEWITDFLKQTQ